MKIKFFVVSLCAMMIISGCGKAEEKADSNNESKSSEQYISEGNSSEESSTVDEASSADESSEHTNRHETNDELVNQFELGGISYDFSSDKAMYSYRENSIDIDSEGDGMTVSKGYTSHNENGDKIGSFRYYVYTVKDPEDWADTDENCHLTDIVSYYGISTNPEYEYNNRLDGFRDYSYDAGEYIIQAQTVFNTDGSVTFDIAAATNKSSAEVGKNAYVYYTSIVATDESNSSAAWQEIINKWSSYFGVDMSDIEIVSPDTHHAYYLGMVTDGGIVDDTNTDRDDVTDFELRRVNEEETVKIHYENGINIIESLVNTSDPSGWAQYSCKAGKTDCKYFKGDFAEVFTYNIGNEEASYDSLPLGAAYMDTTGGELYINGELLKNSSDIVASYGEPYYVSDSRMKGNSTFNAWFYQLGDSYLYFDMENEDIVSAGILQGFFLRNSSNAGRFVIDAELKEASKEYASTIQTASDTNENLPD